MNTYAVTIARNIVVRFNKSKTTFKAHQYPKLDIGWELNMYVIFPYIYLVKQIYEN